MKLFFKALRVAVGPFLLLWEFITKPKGLVRVPVQQATVDAATRNLVLYQFKTCPFCIKVRQEMTRLSLTTEKRDAQHHEKNRSDLIAAVGKPQVPCLQITHDSGRVEWLLDSKAIMAYLQGRFAV